MCFNSQPEDYRDYSLTNKNGEKSLRKSLSQIDGCLLNLDQVLWTDVDASIVESNRLLFWGHVFETSFGNQIENPQKSIT